MGFFKLTVGALRTDLLEFQGQNFKIGGHTGGRIGLFLHIGIKCLTKQFKRYNGVIYNIIS